MKFVVEMNMGPEWVAILGHVGYDALHWSSIGATDAGDDEIMHWARDNGRVVLTADLDFGTRLVRSGENSPSVVQLRTEDTLVRLVGRTVLAAINETRLDLAAGALVTVESDRYRIRRLLPPEST